MERQITLRLAVAVAVAVGGVMLAVSLSAHPSRATLRTTSDHWVASRLLGRDASPTAINDRGHVVGYAYVVKDCYHAVLWNKGKLRDLGTLGGRCSLATDINDRGQVVGWSYTDNREIMHAFLWERGRMHDLGSLGGPRLNSQAEAINEQGQIVGIGATAGTGHYGGKDQRAVLWENGTIRDLGKLRASDTSSGATGINDRGQIVGWSGDKGVTTVFMFERGRMRNLNIRSDYGRVVINNHSQVATMDVVWRAGRLTRLSNTGKCWIAALNDQGQMVGSCDDNAVLWENGQMVKLSTSWPMQVVSGASAINDHNQIAGGGNSLRSGNGENRAWLWTIKNG